jgi:hypothetical protein
MFFILDDKESMSYLNDWDRKIPNLDVVDNYRNEREQIRALRGKNVPFSFGDVSNMNKTMASLFPLSSYFLVYCENSTRWYRQLV